MSNYSVYTQDGSLNVNFDLLTSNDYANNSNVPSEPLENGAFSSDSKQSTPFKFNMIGIVGGDKYVINNAITALEKLSNSALLCSVDGYFKTYNNVTLTTFTYHVDNTNVLLYANLAFKYVILTTPAYTSSKYKNPLNHDQVQRGLVQGTNPVNSTKATSQLFNWFGKVS